MIWQHDLGLVCVGALVVAGVGAAVVGAAVVGAAAVVAAVAVEEDEEGTFGQHVRTKTPATTGTSENSISAT